MEGRRKRGRQRKRQEDGVEEWTGIDFANSSGASEGGTGGEGCCEFIWGAPSDVIG